MYKGFPVVQQYRYLGVIINESGSLEHALKAVSGRSYRLVTNTAVRSYVSRLRFENQYLLWGAYVRPFLQYIAGMIYLEPNFIQNGFHTAWRVTIKRFLGLPDSLPDEIFQQLFGGPWNNSIAVADRAAREINTRVVHRSLGVRQNVNQVIQQNLL